MKVEKGKDVQAILSIDIFFIKYRLINSSNFKFTFIMRINSTKYNDFIVDAITIDDHIDDYDKSNFVCQHCGCKLEYNRGINAKDPHFKNGKLITHKDNCAFNSNYLKMKKLSLDTQLEYLIATILPRSKRLNIHAKKVSELFKRHILGRQTKKFVSSLSCLYKNNTELLNQVTLVTENGEKVFIKDIIKRQDEICDELDKSDIEIRILHGVIGWTRETKGGIKVELTIGKYKNSKSFYLFIPNQYIEKNKKYEDLKGKRILCYGVPVKNEYGCKMDLLSITHQIYVIQDFNLNK